VNIFIGRLVAPAESHCLWVMFCGVWLLYALSSKCSIFTIDFRIFSCMLCLCFDEGAKLTQQSATGQ
jgi:hypothetical protein